MDFIAGLLTGFIPEMIALAATVSVLVLAYLKGRSDHRKKSEAEAARKRLDTREKMDRINKETEVQDDTSLADRLSGRR